MNESYFRLLGLDPSLPDWETTGQLYDVIAKLRHRYNDLLPDEFMRPLEVLGDEKKREMYRCLLKWAASGEPIECGDQVGETARAAEALHFRVERHSETSLILRNLGVPNPPPPPPPDELLVGTPSRAATPPEPPRTAQVKEQYGCVNGQIPSVALGKRVFTIEFCPNCKLVKATDLGDCFHFQWSQTRTGLPMNDFAYHDFLAPLWSTDFIEVGRNYFITTFRDTVTGKSYQAAYCGVNTTLKAPIITSFGIWDMFPWWMKFIAQRFNGVRTYQEAQYRYGRENPNRPVAPTNFFGHDGWTTVTSQALRTFLYETNYWTRAELSGWTAPPEELRKMANEGMRQVYENLVPFNSRMRKKAGLL